MSADVLYRELELNGYRVEDSWNGQDGSVFVLISVPRESLRCRECGCSRVHLHDSRERFWKAPPLGLTPVFITMKTHRVKCLQCGSRTWHQPTFAHGQRQITKKFEAFLEAWLSRLTIQDVVEVFGVSWNTVCRIDIRRLKKLSRPGLAGMKRLAIDEVYLGKNHKFITLVVDLETRAVISVAPGRGLTGLQGIFMRLKQAKAAVQAVATDMAGGYISAVIKYLPKAKLVFDHFHVTKLMNEKLTTLRRDLHREQIGNMHRDVLKGIRWLLLKNPENLTQSERVDERQRLDQALALNKPLAIAYYLKEDLRQFWNQKSIKAAEKFLDDWCRRADASGIRVLKTMAKTLRAHRQGLLNWYLEPISSGPIEGINNKIGAMQRRAYGYRNYEHLKQRILTLHHTKFTLRG
ncbi:MAG: ISL3 family transposase [Planctomycetaceae bacterium]